MLLKSFSLCGTDTWLFYLLLLLLRPSVWEDSWVFVGAIPLSSSKFEVSLSFFLVTFRILGAFYFFGLMGIRYFEFDLLLIIIFFYASKISILSAYLLWFKFIPLLIIYFLDFKMLDFNSFTFFIVYFEGYIVERWLLWFFSERKLIPEWCFLKRVGFFSFFSLLTCLELTEC